jgi:hypothetical protein
MTQATAFSFNNRDTYKEFAQATKEKKAKLMQEIRQEKYAIKEVQRKNASANVSYLGIKTLRETIQDVEQVQAKAKLEAHRQYTAERVAA